MLPRALIKDHDLRRLRIVLALLFVALAVPTGAVIWQAYSRLKWEAFHQYRSQAEELTERIDGKLVEQMATAEARSFTEYSFLNVTGEPGAGFVQRSALSVYPVVRDLPGIIGYFQVDGDGAFSTPLLPGFETDPAAVGIGTEELAARHALTREIRRILADNRLVEDRVTASVGAARPVRQQDFDQLNEKEGREERRVGERAAGEAITGSESAEAKLARSEPAQSQLGRANRYGKVQDLQLDDALDKKSESLEQAPQNAAAPTERDRLQSSIAERSRRVEKSAMLEAAPAAPAVVNEGASGEASEVAAAKSSADASAGASVTDSATNTPGAGAKDIAIAGAMDIAGASTSAMANTEAEAPRITTFESEVDPYEFSQLDSGHFVLFRKVWRDGERFTQGFLLDRDPLLGEVIESAFRATTLSAMSNLVVGYRDDVIQVLQADGSDSYLADPSTLQGALLYRSRLSAPLDSLELIFSVNRLPPGPGATVLGWTTFSLAVIFLLGFYAIYRLGTGQIRLARQQQDFVSAVSHELKTPLTSIRMYGEMLKEGWVDETKRKQYYEYIHDESERLTRLISNVLQLASMSRNEPQFVRRPVSVSELLDQVRSKIFNQVERSGFELAVEAEVESRQACVRIDADCFTQIIINLVDNAIKFSRNSGARKIDIGATVGSDGWVRFSVRDYGPGISRDQIKKIFKLFYRTESELTRETVGTGIGLAIVHQLAVAMSGKVDVINREPGAEFGVSFPVEAGSSV